MNQIFSTDLEFDDEKNQEEFVPVTSTSISNLKVENVFTPEFRQSQHGSGKTVKALVPTTCGHLMHDSCLQTYLKSIETRQHSQPMRNHAERMIYKEFLCPLCKSLG